MKIVITNTVCLNGGDAAILQAVALLLREAFGQESDIVVLDRSPEIARKYYPNFHFEQILIDGIAAPLLVRPIQSLARRVASGATWLQPFLPAFAQNALRHYREADLVVSTGGTYLVEHYRLEARAFEFDLIEKAGRPLILFTQSLGPFRKQESQRLLTSHFRRARLILLRDDRSRDHLLEIGVPGKHLRVVGDSVFALATEPTLARLGERRLPERGAQVVVSIRDWKHFSGDRDDSMQRYLASVVAMVEYLVRDLGARVQFLSTCQGIGEYATDDSAVAARLVDSLPEDVRPHVVADRSFHSTDELLELFGAADFVIATRMHAAILSLIAGTPVLPIAYEFKTTELFASLGFAELTLQIDTMAPEPSVATLKQFLNRLDSLRPELSTRVRQQFQSARSVVPLLQEAINRKARHSQDSA